MKSNTKTALVVFGTRPEAIKMAPIVSALSAEEGWLPVTCATAQHRELLDQVVSYFRIPIDFDLGLMRPGQDLFGITRECLNGVRAVIEKVRPDVVLVQGDTTTAFAAALAAFYCRIPVGHVEAGLRTGERYSPFPEELNRKLVTSLAELHFAPTTEAAQNLRKENIDESAIFQTGNTGIDALLWAAQRAPERPELSRLWQERRMILMTAHRRENFGEPLRAIFQTVRDFLLRRPDVHVIYPVHPNPNVTSLAKELLLDLPNLSLIAPVGYPELIFLLKKCWLVLTDSGGLQEEAPALGKPVLVLRESTERPEAVSAGSAILVGQDPALIVRNLEALCRDNSALYRQMSGGGSPYGDGHAAERIADVLNRTYRSEGKSDGRAWLRDHMRLITRESGALPTSA